MYELHTEKKEVLLWVFLSILEKSGPSRERSRSPRSREVPKATASITKKRNEVEDIVEKLEEPIQESTSPEELHTWAHLIHKKKHSSYRESPDKLFFFGKES